MDFFYNLVYGPPSASQTSSSSRPTPVVPRSRKPAIDRCAPPKCERDRSGACVLPNPWIVFLRSDEARGLTMNERKKAYVQWKNDYMAMVQNDPVAFRAAMCMGRKLAKPAAAAKKPRRPNKQARQIARKYVAGLRQRMHYVKECDIRPETIEFFSKLIPTENAGTKLTTCDVIGRGMLRTCVPPSEVDFYTFKKVLGIGLHGFVFQCLYKGREERAIKLVVLHDGGDENAFSLRVDKYKKIESVSKPSLVNEFKMHQHMLRLMEKSGRFRVLNVLSDLCVFKPPKFDKFIGVYIMENLQALPFDDEIDQALSAKQDFPSLILDKVMEVPRVIAELHRLGAAHSDMHPGNVAFDAKDPRRPYVLDFGRVQMLKNLGNQAQLYRILEYAVPLHAYLRWYGEAYPNETVQMYNAYVRGVYLTEADEKFVQANKLEYIFRTLVSKGIRSRLESLDDLLANSKRFTFGKEDVSFYYLTEMLF